MDLPLLIRKTTEANNVTGVSLSRDLERPLHEAVKLKTRLPWRDQDVRIGRMLYIGICHMPISPVV